MFEDREIAVATPLAPEELIFTHMEGHDEISRPFAFRLGLASENLEIAAADLLGQPFTIRVGRTDPQRFFHGLAAEFRLTSPEGPFAQYEVVLRPWLWFLSNSTDNRIFQDMSVVEIVEAVFGDYPAAKYELRLQGTYEPREYCVQYGESDLDFVQRLLEHEGIFYFFEHADGEHRMVLADANAALAAVPDFDTIPYQPDMLLSFRDGKFVTGWVPRAEVVTGTYTQTDYDFTKPSADLMSTAVAPRGHAQDGGERYRFPGDYAVLGRGDALSRVRIEEVQASSQRAEALTTAWGLWSGAVFAFEGHPRAAENDDYLILRADYEMWDDQYRAGAAQDRPSEGYRARLQLAPKSLPFRPARRTPRPVMKGPQTAVVVGPGGEEIFTDEYARVKVQFHWDRLGAKDENSTCFIRVSSVWAGAGWGFIQIPRIGQEVIVDFLEGDPDRPIITGRVYNAQQMPPYGLPGNATQSGWKSMSSPGGGGFNELRFEDRKGSEEVWFQAEKDHNELVKNNETRSIGNDWVEDVGHDATQSVANNRSESVGVDKDTTVGNNRTVSIGANDTETVGANRSLTVGANETISVGSNSVEMIGISHTQTVGAVQTITVGAARIDTVGAAENRTVGAMQRQQVGSMRMVDVGGGQIFKVGKIDLNKIGSHQITKVGGNQTWQIAGDQASTVGKGRTVSVGKSDALKAGDDVAVDAGKKITISAGDQIVLQCGSAAITLKKDGTITIEGKDVSTSAKGKVNVKASGEVTIKGSKINQN